MQSISFGALAWKILTTHRNPVSMDHLKRTTPKGKKSKNDIVFDKQ